jgi:hypothetical protein
MRRVNCARGGGLRSRTALTALAALIASSAPAQTTEQTIAGDAWRSLTANDVEAAHTLLADNHPGAEPAVGDKQFPAALEAAYARALVQPKTVASYPGLSGDTCGICQLTG